MKIDNGIRCATKNNGNNNEKVTYNIVCNLFFEG